MKVWMVYSGNFFKGAFSVEGKARGYKDFIDRNFGLYSASIDEAELPGFNPEVLDEKWREYEKNGYWSY
jgi:hypothetical protein